MPKSPHMREKPLTIPITVPTLIKMHVAIFKKIKYIIKKPFFL